MPAGSEVRSPFLLAYSRFNLLADAQIYLPKTMTYNPLHENSFEPTAENIKKALDERSQPRPTTGPNFSNVLPPISEKEKEALKDKMMDWLFKDT